MRERIEVTLQLKWTYGVPGPDGQTRYVGPGRVTLPLNQALSLGGNMATATYRWKGKKYTAETLAEAPEEFLRLLRKRGVKTPETLALPTPLTDIDGVGEELAAALHDAGYTSVEAVAKAGAEELAESVSGVGAKSAPRLVEAAKRALGATE